MTAVEKIRDLGLTRPETFSHIISTAEQAGKKTTAETYRNHLMSYLRALEDLGIISYWEFKEAFIYYGRGTTNDRHE